MHIDKHEKVAAARVDQPKGSLLVAGPNATDVGRPHKTNGFPTAIRLGVRRVAYRVAEVETLA